MDEGAQRGTTALLARAAAADLRADQRLRAAISDFFLADDARLDDRTRTAVAAELRDLALAVEGAVRRHAARLLATRDEQALAEAMEAQGPTVLDGLIAAGVAHDPDLMRELFGRVRQNLLADSLPSHSPDDPDRPSLLPRLVDAPDGVIASSAVALLAAESRRRLPPTPGQPRSTDLPAELHHRLVWWAAAALRGRFAGIPALSPAALDRALAEAGQRSIAAHDEGERMEAAALRLAAALDPQVREVPDLLVEALADRRLSLFVALLAHLLRLDYADVREAALDPGGERLWLMLRALEVDRAAIARIGLALSDADPGRDIDHFAESLDDIVAIAPEAARQALAPLLLNRDYRAALIALERGTRR